MSGLEQWARVKPDLNYRLRRGAWYRVLRSNLTDAVVQVEQRDVTVPLAALQLVSRRPERWTVVALPRDAVDIPFSWGSRYGVCPKCSARAPLLERVATLHCTACDEMFAVGWTERYFT
jgi:hypothetical protein